MWLFIDDDALRAKVLDYDGLVYISSLSKLKGLANVLDMRVDGLSLDYDLPGTGFRDGFHAWEVASSLFRIPDVIIHSSRRSYSSSKLDDGDILFLMDKITLDTGLTPKRVRYEEEERDVWAAAWKAAATIGPTGGHRTLGLPTQPVRPGPSR